MLDSLIIGAGVAGMSAAIYHARRQLNFRIISKEYGGQTAKSSMVENYLGLWGPGYELTNKMHEQLKNNGVTIEVAKVTSVAKIANGFEVMLDNGEKIETKTVILTAGKKPRHLGVPGEEEFEHKGVTYCATCDGPLFRGKNVTVVGGGNSAMDAALTLASYCESVTMIQNMPTLTGEKILEDKVLSNSKINIHFNSIVKEIKGSDFANEIIIENTEKSEIINLPTQGIFIEIGWVSDPSFIDPALIDIDERKELIVNDRCETKTPGLFAAGDFTTVPFKQSIIAAGQGAIASLSAQHYLETL